MFVPRISPGRPNKRIFDAWMACYTMEEIAEREGITKETVSEICQKMAELPESDKALASHAVDYEWPLFKVWKGQDIILDGHNRYEICTRLAIPFDTQEIELPDRATAFLWIIKNQFGRRDLNDAQRAALAHKSKPIIEKMAKERQATSTGGSSPQLMAKLPQAEPVKTRAELAKMAGISPRTMADAGVVLEKGPEPLQEKMLAGQVSIHAAAEQVRKEQREQRTFVKPLGACRATGEV